MQTENETPRAKQFLAHLASWAGDLNQFAQPDDLQETTNLVYKAFLCSEWADDNQLRNSAIVIFSQLGQLYQLMEQYNQADFKNLDRLILKLQEPCTTETNKA